MPETIETPTTIATPSTETKLSTPAPEPATIDKQKLADPFADIKPAPKVTPEPDKTVKAPDKGSATPKAETDRKAVVKKNPIEEQRNRIEQQNKIIAETTKERDELKNRMKQLEVRGGGDTEAMAKMVEDLKKKNEQLAKEISSRDYSKSEEFQTKYEKPFNDAAEYSKKIIESLQVLDGEGTPVRIAKWETDFAPLFQLPRPAARQRAKELFGEDAGDVMKQYDELHRLQESKETVLSDWQKGAVEREQKQRAESLVRQQNVEKAFQAVTQNYIENDPDFQIKPDEKDTLSLWEKSQSIVDKAFFQRENLAPHELILLDAAVRLRAINEPILRAKISKLQEELNDYKSRFGESEESVSGKTRRTAPPSEDVKPENWKSELMQDLKNA